MKRWHEDVSKMRKQSKVWDERNAHLGDYAAKWKRPLGKFRKRHALDCGKAGCYICHSEKILHIKSKQDEVADLNFKEQLGEKND